MSTTHSSEGWNVSGETHGKSIGSLVVCRIKSSKALERSNSE